MAPNSITWRVNREAALVLGRPRALLRQLAHPLVAAGVAEHGDFRSDPLGRLWRTLDTMQRILFGEHEVAEAALRRALPYAPSRLRLLPHARRAEWSLRRPRARTASRRKAPGRVD